MRTIGITGGVGAGKSELLAYIEKNYNSRILLADTVGHLVKQPGQPCYEKLVALMGKEILFPDGQIDRKAMAERIFADPELLEQVNGMIHPAVETYILEQIHLEKVRGTREFFFVEAALLIECGYEDKMDELWYIYADREVRARRLKASRGYSDEKIQEIMDSQLSEEEFRRHCQVVIDNSGSLQDAYRQIDEILKGNV